jgi:hypothetical protein
MTQYVDDLTASGSPLLDDELVTYLLAGLNEEYNHVFTAVVARVDPISPSDLYAQLLNFEQHTHIRGHGFPGRGIGRGQTRNRGRGRSSSGSHPQCLVCLKIGHTTNNCWHRFEEDYVLEPQTVATASGPSTDDAWYMDPRATDHITGELDWLMMHEPYTGTDQIHTANGSGMEITRIGTSIVPTSGCDLVLNKVLHVSSTHKNLIAIHCFTLDNDTYIEFHPFFSY